MSALSVRSSQSSRVEGEKGSNEAGKKVHLLRKREKKGRGLKRKSLPFRKLHWCLSASALAYLQLPVVGFSICISPLCCFGP
ncbi:hypothetical protein HPP92_018313 [Vanilla planifolia]|uniref:Uncharacterized protein n=1 Tax=Vanilla planifolia TaxID=51239 RepID=A0A835UMA7_VANPL|nr:hypothetical protein HPP92_018313 [Vanilla planifolia]